MIAQAEGRRARWLLPVVGAVVLSACAGTPAPVSRDSAISRSTEAPATKQMAPAIGERATAVALAQVGVPYRYGGESPATGFDCSGLVHYAYVEAGRSLPRTTSSLWSYTERVPRSRLVPGDLVFFSIEGKMQHVGLYIGSDRFVHAPSSGRSVSVESLSSPFYSNALLSGGRLR